MTENSDTRRENACTGCGCRLLPAYTICQDCEDRASVEELDSLRAERDELRALLGDFLREVGAAVLGPPEEGTEWGGGGILDGIRDLKVERNRYRDCANELRTSVKALEHHICTGRGNMLDCLPVTEPALERSRWLDDEETT